MAGVFYYGKVGGSHRVKVKILGEEYTIEEHKISEDEYMKKMRFSGYCSEYTKKIVYADLNEKEFFEHMDVVSKERYKKEIIRHEILHAFLNESGLSDNSSNYDGPWTKNEEMIDFFAIQFEKIKEVFAKADCI